MRRHGSWMFVAGLLLALGLGVAALYRLRVARGDVFPAYSSLRADPLGTRALHDAAALLPGREVLRWLRAPERLETEPGDVVLVVGVDRPLRRVPAADEWAALDRLAVGGARVVVAWRAETAQTGDGSRVREIRAAPWTEPPPETPAERARREKKEKEEKEAGYDEDAVEKDSTPADDEKAEEERALRRTELARHATPEERRWGVRVLRRELVTREDDPDARRGEDAPADWPEMLPRWRSDLFFLPRPEDGWRVLYRRGAEPVMLERRRGAGSLTLLADGFLLSNEAVWRDRATPVLAALLGDARRVIFLESHLGLKIDSGLAVLARRYGLAAAAFTAAALAGLWIWRRASPLAPILPEDEEVRLTLAPTAGLEALLRRAVTPPKLFSACLDAWRQTATEGDRRRLEAAPTTTDADPVAAYNTTTRALSRKKLS